MDFQQPHRYMRPPPPSMTDPHHHQSQPPPPSPWFSGQFQYHPSQHSSSPPPPPHHQQWAPPPHSDHLYPSHYPAPSHHPYPMHPLHNHHQYPPPPLPPRPHVPPPHPHSQIPQSYHQINQDWGHPSWGHHQGWEYTALNNEEDWASKARAWAAAKTATDNDHPQSHFAPVGRLDEQSHYHDQYPQRVDSYSDVQQMSIPASSYQQYPPSVAPPHRTPVGHLQDFASFTSGYVPDGHLSYAARDGTLAGDSDATFRHQESSPTSLSVHRQEVPSSYSSVAGKDEAGDQNGKYYKSLALPFASTAQHQAQLPLPAVGRSVLMEQPHYAFGNQSAEPTTDLSDQPLDFAPRFSRDHDPHVQLNYTHDSVGPGRGTDAITAMPSIHAWTPPAVPGVVYPPVTAVLSSGPQIDPSVTAPSPVALHSTPIFGRMPGSSFQPTIPSVSASFGITTGNVLHPTTAFPGDAYGASGVSERPKKASVPNWLREEIIKNKAVIESSVPDLSKEETKSIEDEDVDKSLEKGDQADSKSIVTSRSIEEDDDDDDDEDYVEAARTAAINQEIKRVLTEVLSKVTDELFDEIATKVLSEDDLTVEVDRNVTNSNFKVSPSTPAVPTPKASAKVLIADKTKETDSDNVGGKSISSSTGDVLGLASYASDEDEEDEIQNSSMPNSKGSTVNQQPTSRKLSDDIPVVGNGSSQAESEDNSKNDLDVESHSDRLSPNGATVNHSAVVSDNRADRESVHDDLRSRYSSKTESGAAEEDGANIDGEKVLDGSDISKSKDYVGEKVVMKTTLPVDNFNAKKSITDDSQGRETRNKPYKNERYEIKSSSAKDFVKEVEKGKDRTFGKGDESRRREDESYARKENTDDHNGSKERIKEQGVKSGEKAKDSDSRRRLTRPDVKEDGKVTDRDRRSSTKQDNDRKRDRAKVEKGERSRHKLASDSSKHKRRRSSSVGSRDRNSKENSVVGYANDSSDGSSDESRRKVHSKKRSLSPSPVRSRRRQVSRSPHSKRSQRRHSPYSSIETTRGRR